ELRARGVIGRYRSRTVVLEAAEDGFAGVGSRRLVDRRRTDLKSSWPPRRGPDFKIGSATIVAPGRARWGASGSLNPQSALAGPNTARGAIVSGPGLAPVALTVRFRALGACEPRQIPKEAARTTP